MNIFIDIRIHFLKKKNTKQLITKSKNWSWLNARKFFHFGSNIQMCQIIILSTVHDYAQDSDLAYCLGDWSQSERLPDINPPLQ